MTRKECELKLKEALNNEIHAKTFFKHYTTIYDIALYEECLKHDTDPDTIWFYYEAKEGKGKSFTD